MVYFVDDLNLPEVDKYMTQSAIALLRQQMEYGHIYDMTKLAQNPVRDSALKFPCISQLELWEDGVSTRRHRLDAVVMIT